MHPRLLLIDSQLLEVPSQRTRTAAAVQAAVILVQRAAGDPGCADFGYQRQTVLIRLRRDLEGPPGSPKLFLAPAKGGGAPPDACRVGGATASSAASPSMLASGRRMGAGKGGPREGGLHSNALWRHCVVVLCNLLMDYN
jgi:hypothetical protein